MADIIVMELNSMLDECHFAMLQIIFVLSALPPFWSYWCWTGTFFGASWRAFLQAR